MIHFFQRLVPFFLIFALVFSLFGCAAEDPSGKYEVNGKRGEAIVNDAGEARPVSGNNNVFYHIFVGSFSDSNGDGTGDLRGIIDRLDYINDGDPDSGLSLGAEGLWLSPIFTSPSYHKYDTADYYEIDPAFGTEDDLKVLVEECHKRGVKVILDLVINHTAVKHAWFQEFRTAHQKGDTESPYYDFYSWSAEPEAGKTFQPIAGSDHYYECNFSGSMPELNFDSEAVKEAMVQVAKHYLDLGVDGFRFDAAKYIYFGDETRNLPFWEWYMTELRSIRSDIYTVAEVWDSDGVTIPYFSSTNCFNFTMAQVSGQIAQTAQAGDVNVFTGYVADYLSQIRQQREDASMVTFIANHDTDRAAGFLTLASGYAKMGANLSILMPGSTFIYYGEEIGLKGSRGGANTDANRRLAMNWGDGDTVTDPEGADYDSGQTNGTVTEHLLNGDSLYNHYKKLIMLRKANPEIAYGEYTPLSVPDSKAGGFLSTYDGQTVAVFHNTSRSAATIDLAQITDVALTQIAGSAGVTNFEMESAVLEGTVLTIAPQTSVILR